MKEELKIGDRIRLEFQYGELRDFTIEEFRQCLGIFISEAHREAGEFKPLCGLYESSAQSESHYIGNYGSYFTHMVPSWMNIPKT